MMRGSLQCKQTTTTPSVVRTNSKVPLPIPAGLRCISGTPLQSRRSVQCQANRANDVALQTRISTEDAISRKFRRTVFDFPLWEKHRRVDRYWSYLRSMPASRIIWDLVQPLSYVLGTGLLFGIYETLVEMHQLPEYFHSLQFANDKPWAMTSFAVSLLLVFRTNSSYERFTDARKIWGFTLNRVRAISTQIAANVPASDPQGRTAAAKWTIGFVLALRAHLQEDADLRLELSKATPAWTEEEIVMLLSAQHRPVRTLCVLSETIRQLPSLNSLQAIQLQDQITALHDALGGCERLLRTPIPLSYTRHTARFLILWLGTLPFGLWSQFHWWTLVVTAGIGFLLLGIDEIGMQIEEPFGILPLEAICTRAATDINSMIADSSGVQDYVSKQMEGRDPALYEGTPRARALASVSSASSASLSSASLSSMENGASNGSNGKFPRTTYENWGDQRAYGKEEWKRAAGLGEEL